MTYLEWLELSHTKKIFLYHLQCVRKITGLSLVSGKTYTYAVYCEREISKVTEEGTEYTGKSSIDEVEAGAGSFYWDCVGIMLYVHTTDGSHPDNFTIIITHPLYLANVGRPPYNSRFYEPRVSGMPSFSRQMQQVFFGQSQISYGSLAIRNDDGGYDYLQDWIFAGQPFSVRLGGPEIADSDYETVLCGITDKVPGMTRGAIRIPVRDNARKLKKKIPDDFLASGANVPDESVNKAKPLCFGTCYNIPALFTNTSTNEYQVHNGQIKDILAVYDDGTALTYPGDYTKNLASGNFTLASPATGRITADVEGAYNGSFFPEKPGETMKKILEDHLGFTSSDYDASALASLDTDRPYKLGLFLPEPRDIVQIFDEIAESVLATWGFDRLGKFAVGAISDPGASAEVSFSDRDYIRFSFKKDRTPEVIHRVTVLYRRDWGATGEEDRTRRAISEDDDVLYQFPWAGEKTVSSLLKDLDDAVSVSGLSLALLKKQIYLAVFTTKTKPFRVNFLDDVRIQNSRYNIDGYYKVIGIKENYTDNEIELVCYGG